MVINDALNLANRDKRIICGLFLSKYDRSALEYLGFTTFLEAFNALGYSLNGRPAAIKNYRDEFDPYFPNERKGWHGRPLRTYCAHIKDIYDSWSITQLGDLITEFISPDFALQQIPEIRNVMKEHSLDGESSFARRLITGRAAEEYFRVNCSAIPEFQGLSLTDTTGWGCGFDFKLTMGSDELHSAVEVKGMRSRIGQIQLTDLEYAIAERLADRYYLFVVRNFAEIPFHSIMRNPIQQDLEFTRIERAEVRVSWITSIT